MRCANCGGPWHEATGHVLSPVTPTVLCGPCARGYLAWLRGHTNRRWGKVRFYDHAQTSREKT